MSTAWKIVGKSLVSCSCDWGCPCQFNAPPTKGFCEAVLGVHIDKGVFGPTRLDGLTFALLYALPGAPHEGNGTMQLVVDEAATEAQRAALQSIANAEFGGMPFAIYASLCPHKQDPVTSAITFEMDQDGRTGTIRIPGLSEVTVEPIKNPVTGEPHRARIVLPEGFEYKEAEMGNTVSMKVTGTAPLAFEHESCYAQLTICHWSNAA